jgi:hypothetical protein
MHSRRTQTTNQNNMSNYISSSSAHRQGLCGVFTLKRFTTVFAGVVFSLGLLGCKPPAESNTKDSITRTKIEGISEEITKESVAFQAGQGLGVTIVTLNMGGDVNGTRETIRKSRALLHLLGVDVTDMPLPPSSSTANEQELIQKNMEWSLGESSAAKWAIPKIRSNHGERIANIFQIAFECYSMLLGFTLDSSPSPMRQKHKDLILRLVEESGLPAEPLKPFFAAMEESPSKTPSELSNTLQVTMNSYVELLNYR